MYTICNNIDGPRVHYTKWNESEKDKMSYNFAFMWALNNKINEQTKQNQIHRYREQIDEDLGDG